MSLSKQDTLAASAPWVAVVLNLVPGLGTGYIYQRRWRAYWITSAVSTSWFALGLVLGRGDGADLGAQDDPRQQLVGLLGLLLLAGVTAVEAGIAARRARAA
ncbi:hypothetical protein VB734_02850 [Synechococcus sp. BA-124 BA4]|uniref:hypothetical protein n=1 Tax=unclassified Synechococcus TaxID=2626047 RepID=UPI0018CEF703|nr:MULTISPECIES: hypothetical protein [unclassified Synechococcus]MEA5398978.1 hypothetical protein [Synechococcus sp. BA-124 BA4]QPN55586.1 hypothetical protein I1E95_10270 [Synechococcus sp. CBW1107]CAK6690656.1 hypothetical protein BBFGKLBO_00862 [Synechococcus sp. CBW1107]